MNRQELYLCYVKVQAEPVKSREERGECRRTDRSYTFAM